MKVYLAGPMSGLPEWNYPAFHEAAATLRSFGYDVENPAENHDGRTDLPLAEYFKLDLPQVCESDAVVVLPGWRQSSGAGVEVRLAEHLNKPVLRYDTIDEQGYMETIYETAVEEAFRLVHGPRGVNYGHPLDDFTRTGKMWGAILGTPPVPAELVGLCMAAVKISREVNAPKRDNRVDLAGYAETIEMIARAREKVVEPNGSPGPVIDERIK